MDSLPVHTPLAGFAPLAGVRVLDLTTSIAGPYATQLLGDFGADVLKVERMAGDDARAWGPPFLDGESLWFLTVNRNKRSLAVNYGEAAGMEILTDLIANCDVIVLNQPPRVMRKLGLDPDSVRRLREDIIYVSITGFGMEGERADWPCYDLIAEGYSGIMDLTGPAESEAQKIGAPAADVLAGQDAAMATLAALFDRQRSGQGRIIDIALVDSMVRFAACRIVPYLGSGEVPRRSGGRDSVIAIYQTFDTADDPITLGLGNDNIWKRFWEALGKPERAADPSSATNADRRANRARLVAEIQDILLGKPRSQWLSAFRAARIPCGPINRVDEVSSDARLIERGLFYRIKDGDRHIPQVGTAIRVDGASQPARLPPPRLGVHTDEVLREVLRYDDGRIADLRRQNVI